MKSFKFLTVILLGVLFSGAVVAQQTEQDIRDLLMQRDEQIKNLMGPEGTEYTDAQRAQLKDIINSIIDFKAMAKEAV
jgi:phospholipid transport system substrate-binding protein